MVAEYVTLIDVNKQVGLSARPTFPRMIGGSKTLECTRKTIYIKPLKAVLEGFNLTPKVIFGDFTGGDESELGVLTLPAPNNSITAKQSQRS